MSLWATILAVLFIIVIMSSRSEHETITIYANSAKRSSGITPQFTVNLNRPITQIKSFEILGVEVPYSFYNIWKGNVGIGQIGTTVFNHGGLLASATVVESNNFLTSPLTLVMKIDGNTKTIPFIFDPSIFVPQPGYLHIQYSINQVGLSATIAVSNYKLVFTITTPTACSKIGFYVNGTSFSLSSYMGLTEDVEVLNLQPKTTTVITMPSPYKIFNPIDYNTFTDYVYAYGSSYVIQAQRQVNGYSSYNLRVNNPPIGLEDYGGTIAIDTDKHYISYMLGFNTGNYSNMESPPNKIIIPMKPPKYYDNNLLILLDRDMSLVSYTVNVPDGYYTPSDLAAYLTSQLALIPELATSTVTVNQLNIFTIVLRTANPHSSIRILQQRFYGWSFLSNKMGFEDLFVFENSNTGYIMEVAGVNITSATFVATKPFKYKPSYLYIKSTILGQLVDAGSSYIDDPTYQLDNIIHKIQVSTGPGGVIKDTKKYQNKRYATHPLTTPISQLDFSLYDEDGQLVQLNGRSWSIGIKIEF